MEDGFKRASVSFSPSTLEYIDKKAKEIGVNRSAMIAFMAENYRKQEDNLEMMKKIDVLKELSDKVEG